MSTQSLSQDPRLQPQSGVPEAFAFAAGSAAAASFHDEEVPFEASAPVAAKMSGKDRAVQVLGEIKGALNVNKRRGYFTSKLTTGAEAVAANYTGRNMPTRAQFTEGNKAFIKSCAEASLVAMDKGGAFVGKGFEMLDTAILDIFGKGNVNAGDGALISGLKLAAGGVGALLRGAMICVGALVRLVAALIIGTVALGVSVAAVTIAALIKYRKQVALALAALVAIAVIAGALGAAGFIAFKTSGIIGVVALVLLLDSVYTKYQLRQIKREMAMSKLDAAPAISFPGAGDTACTSAHDSASASLGTMNRSQLAAAAV